MPPAFRGMNNIPIAVNNVQEILNHAAPGLAGGTWTTWLEPSLVGCDCCAGKILFFTKYTFLLYVSMKKFIDKA